MSILSRVFGLLGEDGINPRRVQMLVTDSFASVTTAGYLTQATVSPDSIYPTDIFDITYAYNKSTGQGVYGQFLPVIGANGVITLVPSQSTNAATPWVPSLSFGGSTVGITYTTQTGLYSLNGNILTFNLNIQLLSKGAAVGGAAISLPFLPVQNSASVLATQNLSFTNTPYFYVSDGSLSASISQNISGGAATQLQNTDFANNTALAVTGSYFITPRLR